MKLLKKQISGITNFYIDNLSIELDTAKRYSINLWSEGTQKQGAFSKTLYFDDTLEEWRTRDCECSNKDKSLDFSIVIEDNVLKSLETLKIYGIDNGGIHIFNEVYFELHEIGGNGDITLPLDYQDDNQITNKPDIPHNAITLYPNTTDPFTDYGGLSTHWIKCLVSADLSTYTLFFAYSYEGRNFPIRILTNWDLFNDNYANCVKITANADSTLTLFNNGGNTPNLQYSTNGIIWLDYLGEIVIRKGSSILLRGNNPTGWSTDETVYSHIQILGDVSLSGNIMGLLDNGTGSLLVIPNTYCFYKLFISSVGITSVSKNFLPATTLKAQCYYQMFNGCSNLRNAPDLPAMELTNDCYRAMFYGCTKLTSAPELPSTTLAINCYRSMFYQCTSLRIAPTLPATTLLTGCYYQMFGNCNSLFSVKIAYTGNFADITNAFTTWLDGVPSYGIIYYNGSDTATGRNAIPTGWVKATF